MWTSHRTGVNVRYDVYIVPYSSAMWTSHRTAVIARYDVRIVPHGIKLIDILFQKFILTVIDIFLCLLNGLCVILFMCDKTLIIDTLEQLEQVIENLLEGTC
jgi:hypothetical protein